MHPPQQMCTSIYSISRERNGTQTPSPPPRKSSPTTIWIVWNLHVHNGKIFTVDVIIIAQQQRVCHCRRLHTTLVVFFGYLVSTSLVSLHVAWRLTISFYFFFFAACVSLFFLHMFLLHFYLFFFCLSSFVGCVQVISDDLQRIAE